MPSTWLLAIPLIFWVTVLGGGGYLALRLVRAFEHRSQGPASLAELEARVQLLEDTVERQATELERLQAGHAFAAALRPGANHADDPR